MKPKSPTAVCIIVENETVPIDRRVWLEARALRKAGYKVSVICPKDFPFTQSRETLEGIEIFRYWNYRAQGHAGYLFEYAWALLAQFYLALKVYAQTPFQVLQACNPADTIFLIGAFFKLLGVRFLFDHHDLSPELYVSRFGRRGLLYRCACIAERLSFRTADMSIATNESFWEVAVTRGGMKPERVVVVRTCADLQDVDRTLKYPELKQGHRHLVVYVGNMGPQDGVELLLQSIRYMVNEKRCEDTLFTLVGAGSELPRLRALTDQWNLGGKIRFTGRVAHEEVGPYLAAADVCVAPDPLNPLNDCCSMIKIFEYMAYAKPIVLYDLKEGRRSAGDAALYARPNDTTDFANQIATLLESASMRRTLGEFGRKRVEGALNWEAQSKSFLGAYETLLSNEEAETSLDRRPEDVHADISEAVNLAVSSSTKRSF